MLTLITELISGCYPKKIKLHSLIVMIIIGMILGLYCFNVIDDSISRITTQLRILALGIILIKAGFILNILELKKSEVCYYIIIVHFIW